MKEKKLKEFLDDWGHGLSIITSILYFIGIIILLLYLHDLLGNEEIPINQTLSLLSSIVASVYMLFFIFSETVFKFDEEWHLDYHVSLSKAIKIFIFIIVLLCWNIYSTDIMTYQEYKRETKIETYESDEEYIEDEDIIYNAISTENGIKHKYEFCSEVNVCGIYYSDKKIEEAAEYQVNFQKETLKFPNNKKSKIVSYQLLFLDDKPTTIPEKSKEELFKENYQEYKIDNDYAYLWSNLILSYTYIIYSILCGQLFYVKYKVSRIIEQTASNG